MDAIYLVLPFAIALIGWATRWPEFYAFAGALGFYTAYTLVSEAAPTNSSMVLTLTYLMFSIGVLARMAVEQGESEKNKRRRY